MNNNHSGDRYLRSLGLRPAQDSDALAAQLRQAVGDAQAEAALSALYTRRTQQETATSGLDRQETAAFYDRKNQHPQASLILSAAHDWDSTLPDLPVGHPASGRLRRHHPGCRL